jgi:hypothetical protein
MDAQHVSLLQNGIQNILDGLSHAIGSITYSRTLPDVTRDACYAALRASIQQYYQQLPNKQRTLLNVPFELRHHISAEHHEELQVLLRYMQEMLTVDPQELLDTWEDWISLTPPTWGVNFSPCSTRVTWRPPPQPQLQSTIHHGSDVNGIRHSPGVTSVHSSVPQSHFGSQQRQVTGLVASNVSQLEDLPFTKSTFQRKMATANTGCSLNLKNCGIIEYVKSETEDSAP